MARLRVPESYKGGRKKWVADFEKSIQVKQQSLANLTRPGKSDTLMRTEGLVECWFSLGLYYHWQGEEEVARGLGPGGLPGPDSCGARTARSHL